jgi:hypothetical protein
MLTSLADVEAYGVAPSERAVHDAREAEACALCGAPELDRLASVATTLAWLSRYEPQDSAALRLSLETPESTWRWEDFRSRAATDSQLEPAYPWRVEWTGEILAEVAGTDLEAIALEELLLPLCDRCFNADIAPARMAFAIRRAYVASKFDGNEAAAMAQSMWSSIERLSDIISSAERLRTA